METPLWPFLVYAISAVCVAIGMLGISFLLGQRHMDRQTGIPYESGIQSTGTARIRFSIKFYLVAILFVIFDLEMVYVFAWAVVMKSLGWSGYFAVLTFLGILIVALIYEWKMGFLDWNKPPKEHASPSHIKPKTTLPTAKPS
jgi:NADH-quinone oxidoreductase subunit A